MLPTYGVNIEKRGEALAVSLDISNAFNMIWHASLIGKLPSYGIAVRLCNWIADFLRGRSIRVVINGALLDLLGINAGIPQGSVVSATLFLLHINDLLLTPGIFGYADDSTVSERYLPDVKYDADVRSLREAKLIV